MTFLGIALIVMAAIICLIEVHANNKRKQINNARKIVYTDLVNKNSWENAVDNNNFKDAMVMGLGSSGLNLIDIYSQVEDHEEVLNVIEQRCPKVIGDASPLEWFSKVENLTKNDSIDSYINLFVGQASENIALDLLQKNGLNAKLYSSLTHPNDDIFVTLENGTKVPYSVKCGSVDYIKIEIKEHPESTHYIINTDAYEQMNNFGLIDDYKRDGIEILDGGYDKDELRDTAFNALNNVHDAGDLVDDIPIMAIAVFGLKIINNYLSLRKGKQTTYEFGMNAAIDLVRVGVGGVFAIGGAKVGACMGGFMVPGIGMLIGGGIGAIVGAISGGGIFNWGKERIKRGKIIDAIDHFGNRFDQCFSENMKFSMAENIFNISDLENKITAETLLLSKYKKQLNPYSIRKVTLPAILCKEYVDISISIRNRIKNSLYAIENDLKTICLNVAQKMHPDDSDEQLNAKKRFLGEIILSNGWILSGESISSDERELIQGYNEQIKNAENHPYRFNVKSDQVLKEVAFSAFRKTEYAVGDNIGTNKTLWIFAILLMCMGIIMFFI